jgi:hypothetical protein
MVHQISIERRRRVVAFWLDGDKLIGARAHFFAVVSDFFYKPVGHLNKNRKESE